MPSFLALLCLPGEKGVTKSIFYYESALTQLSSTPSHAPQSNIDDKKGNA
jgi:hypothetical protein